MHCVCCEVKGERRLFGINIIEVKPNCSRGKRKCKSLLSNYLFQKEIFGPVLVLFCVDTLEDAINLVNENKFGNGAAIFTSSGAAARKFQNEVQVGHVRLQNNKSDDSKHASLGCMSSCEVQKLLVRSCFFSFSSLNAVFLLISALKNRLCCCRSELT